MKPWPDAIKSLYPLPPGTHPTRPWWWWTSLHRQPPGGVAVYVVPVYGWLRTDGVMVKLVRGDDGRQDPGPQDFDAVVSVDREKPLPRPPLRASQVWANEHGEAVALLHVSGNSALHAGWQSRGEHMSAVALSVFDPHAYPYLVADPLWGNAAPWSPVEVGP